MRETVHKVRIDERHTKQKDCLQEKKMKSNDMGGTRKLLHYITNGRNLSFRRNL